MKIRLWKLGSLEHKVLPTQECVQKFRDVLKECTEKDGCLNPKCPEIVYRGLTNE